jgi:hypothetical protein
LFEAYFKLGGFTLNLARADETLYLINDEGFNHLSLKKITTIIMLVLRLLYNEKLPFITLNENISITLKELCERLMEIGYLDGKRVNKKDIKPELAFLRNYNIINYRDSELHDTTKILIYPSVIYLTDLGKMEEILARLQQTVQGVEEETEEQPSLLTPEEENNA